MKKIVIFNVGGALSSYLEFDGNKVIVDLGRSQDFNPVLDFLLPLAQKRFSKDQNNSKYILEQAFLSHLDDDHISSIEEFDKYFHPLYLTAPCDHPKQNTIFDIIRNFIIGRNSKSTYSKKVLVLMNKRLPGHGRRDPSNQNESLQEDKDKPLVVYPSCKNYIELYHIPATICNKLEELKENYSNNLSLALFIKINEHTLFMPGDLSKEGMTYLITNNNQLRINLETFGIDFLIVPHHGLTTSFPEVLFETIKGNKTRLNIISEKVREANSNENRSDVDTRYYSSDYSTGENAIDQYAVKTSKGHIVIDCETDHTDVKQYSEIQDVIKEFSN